MIPYANKRGLVAVFLTIAFVLQGTMSVLAGTTGSITGTVVDATNNQTIAKATVTAASPSQSATTTSDASGRYTFASLSPDTYTVSAAASGNHDVYSVSGITVQADQNVTVELAQPPKLKVIGSVTSRSAGALVKPGTTADVYSINATTQDKASVLGGGGTLNQAWSAMAAVPGVYVAPNQTGYIGAGSTLSIRGGDYNQIGYELDGIPVNRSFDNYPSGSASSLGQQELQVYTGSTPANAEANGISGYINQVIRTGTSPAYRNLTLGIGAPTLYNKISFEAGGANPSRTFSYYLGAGAYNQNFRYGDQFNGASLSRLWGGALLPCSAVPAANYNSRVVPSCFDQNTGADFTNGGVTPAYVLGPYIFNGTELGAGLQSRVETRDTVANFHFGIPRKDGNRDDVQILYDNNYLKNPQYNSTNDQGGVAYLNAIGLGTPTWADGYQTTLPYGTVLPSGYNGNAGVSLYLFPNSPTGRAFDAPIPVNQEDMFVNNQNILKGQYQKNFGTNAFLRVYGYAYYSNWMQTAPQSRFANFINPLPTDYELNSHTRGVSVTFSDQITSAHLLTLQGAYTTASSLRYNNSGFYNPRRTFVGYLVNGSDPYSGTCYSLAGAPVVGCNFAGRPGTTFGAFTQTNALNGAIPQPTAATCGTGPCQYVVVGGGPSATFNTVKPKFYSASITDIWRPTDRLNINVGIRYDLFQFQGSDTTNSGARTLFYNAYNATHPTAPIVNVSGQVFSYPEFQPRIGFTYTLDPRTVLRGSYGRYAEAPNAAFEQYNYLQPNDILQLARFGRFGLPTTPGHGVVPEVSNNFDFSFEHQFPGELSLKLTPFLRQTQNQIQQFFLDQPTNFVSGLNVGRQRSQGFELEVDKGDFSRNGISGRLAFTYTNSYIRYNQLPNGSTVIGPINSAITTYNGFTAAGGGSPCYAPSAGTTAGAGVACTTPGAIANPYFNAPIQALLDPNGSYPTYSLFPGPPTVQYHAFSVPYVATLIVQYKKDKFAFTPALQFSAGTRYGVPETTNGITPNLCSGALAGTTAGDPRYQYGGAGGAPYDASTCDTSLVIPNQFTKQFDPIGSFVEPNQLQLHLQMSYNVNPRLTLVGNFANVYTRCWGGSNVPFKIGGSCGYQAAPGGEFNAIGNAYNPGNTVQPALLYPYFPIFGGFPTPGTPFQMGFEARLKI